MNRTKRYLGDGVYAELDYDGIKLTTENGIEITNEIYLESQVLDAFLLYIETVKEVKEETKD